MLMMFPGAGAGAGAGADTGAGAGPAAAVPACLIAAPARCVLPRLTLPCQRSPSHYTTRHLRFACLAGPASVTACR